MKRILFSLLTTIASFNLQANDPLDNLIKSHQEAAFTTYQFLSGENVVYSPYSLFTTLSMVYQGAEGQTKQAIGQTLHLSIPKEQIPELYESWQEQLGQTENLTSANGLWIESSLQLLPGYSHTIENTYGAKVESANFSNAEEVVQNINGWVAEKTKNTIKNFLAPSDLTPATRLVLVNTLFVNQEWRKPFSSSKEGVFLKNDQESLIVPLLYKKEVCSYFETIDMQMAVIPMKNTKTACVVFLPKVKVSLEEIEKKLSSEFFKHCLASAFLENLEITIPKFNLSEKIDLSPTLKNLGMEVAFSDQADLSGITGSPNLCIEKVFQQVDFIFGEKGIKASAATGASIGLTSAILPSDLPTIPFEATHPFLFLLIDSQTETILFAGKYQGIAQK